MTPSKGTLTLGWVVDANHQPIYWMKGKPQCGKQQPVDLVTVPAVKLAAHTVIVAQSGSGKSYFLGRLIEEILLHTKARCVVLDPNGDFRSIHRVKDTKLWTAVSYGWGGATGGLPHEKNRRAFASHWSRVKFRIRVGPQFGSGVSYPYKRLRLRWNDLTVAAVSEDADPKLHSDIFHCHDFVRKLAAIIPSRAGNGRDVRLFNEAERVFDSVREDATPSELMPGYPLTEDVQRVFDRAMTIKKDVSAEARKFYFGRARQYENGNMLDTGPASEAAGLAAHRLEVIDLPSIRERQLRFPAISAVVGGEKNRALDLWEKALKAHGAASSKTKSAKDKRVPTFIVVDEAHNLMPSEEPRGGTERTLRDQFRTIAAEGRKYGLFLILVSQRPDKLDPMIVSECENRAVMRIGSSSSLDITRKLLGLDDVGKKLSECIGMGRGLALIAGNWSDEAQVLYTAARRTMEGGGNLDDEYWAVPAVPR